MQVSAPGGLLSLSHKHAGLLRGGTSPQGETAVVSAQAAQPRGLSSGAAEPPRWQGHQDGGEELAGWGWRAEKGNLE